MFMLFNTVCLKCSIILLKRILSSISTNHVIRTFQCSSFFSDVKLMSILFEIIISTRFWHLLLIGYYYTPSSTNLFFWCSLGFPFHSFDNHWGCITVFFCKAHFWHFRFTTNICAFFIYQWHIVGCINIHMWGLVSGGWRGSIAVHCCNAELLPICSISQ